MHGIHAYKRTKEEILDPRQSEKAVFERVTDQLRAAAELERRTEVYHRAVLANRELWAADVSDPSNVLPQELKENLISLGLWVQRESAAAATGEAELAAMIGVNEAVITGLSAA